MPEPKRRPPSSHGEIRALSIGFRGSSSRDQERGNHFDGYGAMHLFLAAFLILWALGGYHLLFLYCGLAFWAVVILAGYTR